MLSHLMKLSLHLTALALFWFAAITGLQAQTLTRIPGPDEMGGMVMPTVKISGTTLSYFWTDSQGDPFAWNPATDSVEMMTLGDVTEGNYFNPLNFPVYSYVLNPASEGGNGSLFSTQYGFWVDGSSDFLPGGNYLALTVSSMTDGLIGWNEFPSNGLTAVFTAAGDTVLWNGSMWHTLFTVSPFAEPGYYSMTFEVSVMTNTNWSPNWNGAVQTNLTGFVANADYAPISITYTFQVPEPIPEPSAIALGLLAVGLLISRGRKARSAASRA